MDGDGKGQRLRGVCVGDVELFLGGAHNARRGGLCELWPMAISVTLLFRPSGSLVLCFRVVAADLIAGRPNNICSCCSKTPRPCASSCSMSSRKHALMLIVLAGCEGPCLLRTPHLGVPRSVFVPHSAPVTSLRPSNMDIDRLGKHPALSSTSSLGRDASLLRF